MKKLWVNIGIFFGCFLLLITCLGAVLIMAPGMELLGIMYIRKTSGSVESKHTISNAGQFQNIYVESDNIPVEIEFIQSNSIRVELIEQYDGFAKASPSPKVEIAHQGDTIVIKSHEYKPFIAHSRSEESGFKIKVPIYYNNNITVVSRKSKVDFCGLGAAVNDILVDTGGEVRFESDLKMHALNLTLDGNNAIISDAVVMYGSIVAKSNGGDLTIPQGFQGRVEFTSSNGDLFLGKCAQLTFKSKTGDLRGVGGELPHIFGDAIIRTDGKIQIGGIEGSGIINAGNRTVSIGKKDSLCLARLEIYTTLGDVNLIGAFTNSQSKIKTKYGDITIESVAYANIETTMGDVEINNTLIDGQITTKSGDVSVQVVSGLINITTKSGDVELGCNNYVLDNVNATTKSGDIEVLNAGNGEIVLTTNSGDVEFYQATEYKSKLTINANKSNVVLNGLTGETNVVTNRKITASVYDVNEPINLTGKNKRVEVHVRKTCYVDLESKKDIEVAPGMVEPTKKYRNAPLSETKQIITIKTNKGEIAVITD